MCWGLSDPSLVLSSPQVQAGAWTAVGGELGEGGGGAVCADTNSVTEGEAREQKGRVKIKDLGVKRSSERDQHAGRYVAVGIT
jgi:hypothetical protein